MGQLSERSERVFRYWDKTGNESINRVLTFNEMIKIARLKRIMCYGQMLNALRQFESN